jgi:hypothetical protein
VTYRYWTNEHVNIDLSSPVPADAGSAVYVQGPERAYHWLEDVEKVIITENEANRRSPQGIDIGPRGYWFSFDGQFSLQHLLTKQQQPRNARWAIDTRGDRIAIGVGGADKESYYRLDFQLGAHLLPLGYESVGGESKPVRFAAELKWNTEGILPSPSLAKFFKDSDVNPDASGPWLAFSCGKIEQSTQTEESLAFSLDEVPDGTFVVHYRAEGVRPANYYKGGKDATEVTEKRLRKLAEELKDKER